MSADDPVLYKLRDSGVDSMRDVFEASDHAEKLKGESMQRPDFIEGITAFFEKRTPNFPPLKEATL